MIFQELTIDAEILRAGNEESFRTFTDADLVAAMNSSQALLQLKIDIQDALSLEPDDTETLDTVAGIHSERLVLALCYKCLYFYFSNLDEGDGSRANTQMKAAASRYGQIKALFPRMEKTRISTNQFLRIRR